MKILIGNGKRIEVREISEPIYEILLKEGGGMLPIHGHKILSDDEARRELTRIKRFGVGRKLSN